MEASLDLIVTEVFGDEFGSVSTSFETLFDDCCFGLNCCFCQASFELEAETILTEHTVVIGVVLSQATTEEAGTLATVRNWQKNQEGKSQ